MKILKKILKWAGIAIALVLVAGVTLYFIYLRPVMEKMKATKVIDFDKELTIIEGGGGNSGVLVSDSLVIVIDTKMDDAAEQLYKLVKHEAGDKPILVVNTHYHSDHCKGNKLYKGQTILAGADYTKEKWIDKAKEETLPTQWLKGRKDIKMGDETVSIFTLNRNLHTESDIFVYLHKRKMLFGGDVILNKQVPALMDADIDGYMIAMDTLPKQFVIETIVPGHGPIGGIEVLNNFKQYFVDMQTSANDKSKKDELVAKYKDWVQVPLLMSPAATISAFEKKAVQK